MKRIVTAAAAVIGLAYALPSYAADAKKDPKKEKLVKRGEYLVHTGGCGDCHTPKNMTEAGPVEDKARALSGQPSDEKLTPAPKHSGSWIASTNGNMTAWAGPWGVSFARNLTPDKETGLGEWTEQNFIDTLRTGKRMGKGRPILPPMPIPAISQYSDDDLKAMFAYLQSIPAVKNAVPEPLPPEAPPAAAAGKPGAAPAAAGKK